MVGMKRLFAELCQQLVNRVPETKRTRQGNITYRRNFVLLTVSFSKYKHQSGCDHEMLALFFTTKWMPFRECQQGEKL
jgi:hypothetical protein